MSRGVPVPKAGPCPIASAQLPTRGTMGSVGPSARKPGELHASSWVPHTRVGPVGLSLWALSLEVPPPGWPSLSRARLPVNTSRLWRGSCWGSLNGFKQPAHPDWSLASAAATVYQATLPEPQDGSVPSVRGSLLWGLMLVSSPLAPFLPSSAPPTGFWRNPGPRPGLIFVLKVIARSLYSTLCFLTARRVPTSL